MYSIFYIYNYLIYNTFTIYIQTKWFTKMIHTVQCFILEIFSELIWLLPQFTVVFHSQHTFTPMREKEIDKLSLKHFKWTTFTVKTLQLKLKNVNSPGFITSQKWPFKWLQTPKVIDRSARDLWSTAREMPRGAEGIMGPAVMMLYSWLRHDGRE